MKKSILIVVMGILVISTMMFWTTTVVSDASLGIYLHDTARLLALVGFVFIFFQYVFSSKIKWIERGIGLDKLFILHRKSGLIGFTFILIHPLFIFVSDFLLGIPPLLQVPKLIGFLALGAFIFAVASAILYKKLHLKYETWKTIHWINYIALPLGFVHSLVLGSDLELPSLRLFWFGLGGLYLMIVINKLWHHFYVRKYPFQITAVEQETHDTWSLYFEGMDIQYKPGQFLIIQLVRNGRVSNPHPFTLSSSPTQDRFSISVKSVGDFTSTINKTTIQDQAYIDAPYGMFSFLNHDAPNLFFIAGGIGVTPFMSMLRYIRDKKLKRKVTLIWGNKTERDIAFRDELEEIAEEVETLQVVHVMSHQDDWHGERGYVNTTLLDKYLTAVKNPQIFLCGPPVMMTKILQSLTELGMPKQRIHYELFSLR